MSSSASSATATVPLPAGATLKVMKSIMIADQLREAQAYGQQRTAELGIDSSDVPARIQEFLKATPESKKGK